jgi:hypothetical protein
VAITRSGYLFAWKTDGPANGRVDWGSFHHDNTNSGNFDLPPDVGHRASGCSYGGRAPDGGHGLGLLAAALLVAWGARRRYTA